MKWQIINIMAYAALIIIIFSISSVFSINPKFCARNDVAVGIEPYAIFAADLDGNTDIDLVVTDVNTNTISVLINIHNESFEPPISYDVGERPMSVYAADLNGDNINDIAVSHFSSDFVSILMNDGHGGFLGPVNYTVGWYSKSVILADLDGMNGIDIAVSSNSGLMVRLNNGSGEFGDLIHSSGGGTGMQCAKLDDDEDFDLVVPSPGSDKISLMLNDGSGSFSWGPNYNTGDSPISVAVADFNSDTYNDIAVANQNSNNVSIFLNDNSGTGNFTFVRNVSVGRKPQSISAADLDLDGYFDLVTTNNGSHNISVLINNGTIDADFQPKVDYVVGREPISVCLADFSRDNICDIAVTNGNVYPTRSSGYCSILIGNGDGTFRVAVDYDVVLGPTSIYGAKLDNDTDIDLAVSGGLEGKVSILKNIGDGTFEQPAEDITIDFYGFTSLFLADVDRKNRKDIVVANGNNLYTLLNNGDGTFGSPSLYYYPSCYIFSADFNLDGYSDIAGGGFDYGGIYVLTNNGHGAFSYPTGYPTGGHTKFVYGALLNNDHYIDLAGANSASNNISVLINNKEEGFLDKVDYSAADNDPYAITAARFDNDPYNDLATANWGDDNVSIFINDKLGGFTLDESYEVGAYPHSIFSIDLDRDRDKDLVVSNNMDRNISILRNGWNGKFTRAVNYGVYEWPNSVFCADFDGDGDIDIAVANMGSEDIVTASGIRSNKVSIIENLSGPRLVKELIIDSKWDAASGTFEYIRLYQRWPFMDPIYPPYCWPPIGGVNCMIAYDASALTAIDVTPGQLLIDCGWEYITYRFGAQGNCDDACPSGLMRIIALAETNDGVNHPSCYSPTDTEPHELVKIKFWVTNDRTYECQFVPINFFWQDCGDNAESDRSGDTLYINRAVYDFNENLIWDEEDDDLFPEDARIPFVGTPDYCLNSDPDKPSAIRFIDFINGGIKIICADSIDDRGDINLNGAINEIADAVVFTNYFIYGRAAFTINEEGQIAATDVNADGIVLSVADLTYLIRIITGDALPYPKIVPATARYDIKDGILSINQEMGAAYLVIEGDAGPVNLTGHMDMKYAYDSESDVTKVLLYSMEKDHKFKGKFLELNGTLTEIEVATYEGATVKLMAGQLPKEFVLHQNKPNPFNPTTELSFSLPVASDVTLEIYNITGQKVTTVAKDHFEAGTHTVRWDGSDFASGIYLYKITAGKFADSKKMLLIK